MGTVVNGMALHGGLRPYGATFFVFSDYMRPAIRLSALMDIPSVWVFTHESVFWGRMVRPINPSSIWPRCGPCPTWRCSDRPMRARWSRRGRPYSIRGTRRSSSGPAKAYRCWTGPAVREGLLVADTS